MLILLLLHLHDVPLRLLVLDSEGYFLNLNVEHLIHLEILVFKLDFYIHSSLLHHLANLLLEVRDEFRDFRLFLVHAPEIKSEHRDTAAGHCLDLQTPDFHHEETHRS